MHRKLSRSLTAIAAHSAGVRWRCRPIRDVFRSISMFFGARSLATRKRRSTGLYLALSRNTTLHRSVVPLSSGQMLTWRSITGSHNRKSTRSHAAHFTR